MATRTDADAPRNIDERQIRQFAAEFEATAGKVSEEASAHSSLIKRIEEAGVNKAAFKLTMKLKKWDATKAQQFLRDLDFYVKAVGILDQTDFSDVLDGFDEADGDEDEDEDDGEYEYDEDMIIGAPHGDIDTESDAFKNGVWSCEQGIGRDKNPFVEDGPLHAKWDTGWSLAFNDGRFGVSAEDEDQEAADGTEPANAA